MTKWKVTLHGCDDSTSFVVDALGDQDTSLLRTLSEMSEDVSEYGCQPVMSARQVEADQDGSDTGSTA